MDRRKFVSYKTAKDFRERFILPFKTLEVDLHIMIGNHDTFYTNTNDVNCVEELLGNRHKNIKIYPEAEEIEFGGSDFNQARATVHSRKIEVRGVSN